MKRKNQAALKGFRGVCALAALALVLGCGQQNESLTEAKSLLKSDKRNRIELAANQLNQALEAELASRDEAETRYLLGYYGIDLSVEKRAELFSEAARLEPRRYEDSLIHEALRDQTADIREAVRLALAERYESRKEPIRRALMDALKGKDNRGRADAAWVLGYLAAEDSALKEGVQQALTHKRMETRLNAVAAIEELARHNPEAARSFIPELLEKIDGKPKRVWWKVWDREGEREAPETRALSVRALGTMGAVDKLLGVLRNKGSSLRSDALQALIAAGESDISINALLELLQEDGAGGWNSSRRNGRTLTQVR